MGFCTSCGELANTPRCPRCKGKVSTATASGLTNRDAWSATYLDKPQNKTYAPNLNKLTKKESIDNSLNSDKLEQDTLSIASSVKKEEVKTKEISVSRLREGKCNKCSSMLNLGSALTIEFNSNHYHRACFICETCSIRLNRSGFELDGKLQCKDCYDKLTASTHSSPSINTPEQEVVTLEPKEINKETKEDSSLFIKHRPRHSFSVKDLEKNTENLSDTLKLLNLETKHSEKEDVSNLVSPSYSKTFQNLQQSVNKSNLPSTSIRGRPRNVSETSSGLSFADLMASRRGKDFKGPTFSRRPISMLSLDSKSKRTSLPVQSKGSSISNNLPQISPLANSNDNNLSKRSSMFVRNNNQLPNNIEDNTINEPKSMINITKSNDLSKRFSLNKTRPISFNFNDKNNKNTLIDNLKLDKLDNSDWTNNINLETNETKLKVPTETSNNNNNNSNNNSIVEENLNVEKESISNEVNKKLNCNKCQQSIIDTWFRLLDGRILHKECFTCRSCNKLFEDGKYSVYNDEEYHAECLLQMTLSPMSDITAEPEDLCDCCNSIITGPCFTLTNGRQYHPKCFICFGCKKQFDQGTYISQDGKEYHRECLPKKDQVMCGKCNKFIEGVFVTNNGTNFHSECFRCTGCKIVITPSTPFGEVSQQPYCEPCLIQQHTSRQASFAVSAARQEQRRSKSTSFSLHS